MTDSREERRELYLANAREARSAAAHLSPTLRLDYLKLAETWEAMAAELDLDSAPASERVLK